MAAQPVAGRSTAPTQSDAEVVRRRPLSRPSQVGVVFFPSHATLGRAFFSVTLAGEGFVRYGLPLPPGFMLSLLLGVGFGNSIGPTS